MPSVTVAVVIPGLTLSDLISLCPDGVHLGNLKYTTHARVAKGQRSADYTQAGEHNSQTP